MSRPRLSPRSRVVAALTRTFLPVAGPLVARHLKNLAVLQTPINAPFDVLADHARLLIFSPHPDDETLGAGGLICRARERNIAVKIVFATNGDGSRTTQCVLNARQFQPRRSLFEIACNRQLEAIRAARELGVDEANLSFLGFPDGALGAVLRAHSPIVSSTTGFNQVNYPRAARANALYCRAGLLDVLQEEIDTFRPTLVLTTHPLDTHLDHAAAFEALELVRRRMPVAPALSTFLIHIGIWPVPNGFHPDLPLAPPAALWKENWRTLELSPLEIETKRRALECHASQLASTPRYLRAFVRRNELFTAPQR